MQRPFRHPLSPPYALVLNPAYTYTLDSPDTTNPALNEADGLSALRAVIYTVKVENATGQLAVVERGASATGAFRLFDVEPGGDLTSKTSR